MMSAEDGRDDLARRVAALEAYRERTEQRARAWRLTGQICLGIVAVFIVMWIGQWARDNFSILEIFAAAAGVYAIYLAWQAVTWLFRRIVWERVIVGVFAVGHVLGYVGGACFLAYVAWTYLR